MRKIIFLLSIFLLFPLIAWAQEKIEVPIWNVGDKWVFTKGYIEVVDIEQNSYTLNFSKDTCPNENKGLEKIIFDKSTLNRIYGLMKDKREKYTLTQRRILNFPLNLGKEWKDTGTYTPLVGPSKGIPTDLIEGYKVLGWENVKIQAGNFKTIKLEYTQETVMKYSGQIIYWYAPEVKYFVKCQPSKFYWNMDRRDSIAKEEVGDWELASFKLQK